MMKFVALSVVVVFFAGCAPEGAVIVSQPPTVKLGNYKNLLVTVLASQASIQENQNLVADVVIWLQNSGNFQKVEPSPEPKEGFDLQLNLKVVSINRVDTGARILAGAWAGQAKVSVECTLLDLKTQQVISTFMVEGKSSSHGYESTQESLKMASEKIAEYILGNL